MHRFILSLITAATIGFFGIPSIAQAQRGGAQFAAIRAQLALNQAMLNRSIFANRFMPNQALVNQAAVNRALLIGVSPNQRLVDEALLNRFFFNGVVPTNQTLTPTLANRLFANQVLSNPVITNQILASRGGLLGVPIRNTHFHPFDAFFGTQRMQSSTSTQTTTMMNSALKSPAWFNTFHEPLPAPFGPRLATMNGNRSRFAANHTITNQSTTNTTTTNNNSTNQLLVVQAFRNPFMFDRHMHHHHGFDPFMNSLGLRMNPLFGTPFTSALGLGGIAANPLTSIFGLGGALASPLVSDLNAAGLAATGLGNYAYGSYAIPSYALPSNLTRSPSANPQAQTEVGVFDDHLSPKNLTAVVGETIQWKNYGKSVHRVVADDGSWDSGELRTGDYFRHTFDEQGTFKFHIDTGFGAISGTIDVRR
jgi:plastocyanin